VYVMGYGILYVRERGCEMGCGTRYDWGYGTKLLGLTP